jgi:hypothetical protein
MSEVQTKFPAVIVVKGFLGIDVGTELVFDWASGKYVSITEEEDIADDYYYSGFAVALDPYLVKDNMAEYFVLSAPDEPELPLEKPIEDGPEEEVQENVEKTEAKVAQELYNEQPKSSESTGSEEVPEVPQDESKEPYHALVVDCACGSRRLLDRIQAPGLSAYLMANDPESFIELNCPECESHLKLWFAPDDETYDGPISA